MVIFIHKLTRWWQTPVIKKKMVCPKLFFLTEFDCIKKWYNVEMVKTYPQLNDNRYVFKILVTLFPIYASRVYIWVWDPCCNLTLAFNGTSIFWHTVLKLDCEPNYLQKCFLLSSKNLATFHKKMSLWLNARFILICNTVRPHYSLFSYSEFRKFWSREMIFFQLILTTFFEAPYFEAARAAVKIGSSLKSNQQKQI